ncbi:MAG TPA: hypothetical protein DIU37_00420 [Opitutae bacterium]|nr:hypothetical protein [Opitutae bacterium]
MARMNYSELKQLLDIILGRGPRGMPVIEALKRLDQYGVDHAQELPQRLKHFLERRSYEKAANFIEENSLGNKDDR